MSRSPMSVPMKSGVYGMHSGKENGVGRGVLITKDRYCDIVSCINSDTGYKNFGEARAQIFIRIVHSTIS